MRTYRFTFVNGVNLVTFGPYETADEARMAFMRTYGSWPKVLTEVKRHKP